MHNTPLANAEFRVTFTETNLRWVLGEVPQNPDKIAKVKAQLDEAKAHLSFLKSN